MSISASLPKRPQQRELGQAEAFGSPLVGVTSTCCPQRLKVAARWRRGASAEPGAQMHRVKAEASLCPPSIVHVHHPLEEESYCFVLFCFSSHCGTYQWLS